MLAIRAESGCLEGEVKNAEGSGMSGAGSCWPTKADDTHQFPTLCPVMSHGSLEIGYGWYIYNVEIGIHYK